jgi:hypothetical protein
MRLTVVHDRVGNIVGAVAHPVGTPPMSPQLEPGQYVADIDVPEITEDLEPAVVFEHVARIVEDSRVERNLGEASLTRKTG